MMLASVLGSSSSSLPRVHRWSGYVVRSLPSHSLSANSRAIHVLVSSATHDFRHRGQTIRPRTSPPIKLMTMRLFHPSKPQQFLFVPPCIWCFKASTALNLAETVFRIALTFFPIATLSQLRSRKVLEKIKKLRESGRGKDLDLDGLAYRSLTYLKRARKITRLLLMIPAVIVAFTLLAGIERTPLTGRWRLILLSPWEEEDIACQLAGTGWYTAVGEILSTDGHIPKLIDPSDWRYRWVQQTLRRLESVIPVLQDEKELRPDWIEGSTVPLPPPSDYPLQPRFRESDYFARMEEAASLRSPPHEKQSIVQGPPYSLLVVDKPDAANAFSYGFGPDGAAGIVVFSGFLEDILAKYPVVKASPEPRAEEMSWWSAILGGFINTKSAASSPVPSQEQTSELAILLAHEVAHLLLSHHIETLSAGSIVGPSITTIVTDVIRTFMFPFTMLFGPFINDALSGVWKTSSAEFAKYSGMCTSHEQEIEADIVSARLLAHAGFDPQHAVRFWENRAEHAPNGECAHAPKEDVEERGPIGKHLPHRWAGSTHPLNIERVRKLKKELERWDEERRRAREDAQRRHAREARAAPAWLKSWLLVL